MNRLLLLVLAAMAIVTTLFFFTFQPIHKEEVPPPNGTAAVGLLEEDLPATIKLASFNVKNLGWDYDERQDLQDMARVIARYDIVALQEVMRKSGTSAGSGHELDELFLLRDTVESETGADWEVVHTDQPFDHGNRYEYSAFIFRTDRVSFLDESAVFPDPGVPDESFEHGLFVREPFYADFRAGTFDFTFITMHAIQPKHEHLDDEIMYLDDVFLSVQSEDECENDVILAGDFNLQVSEGSWSEFKAVASMTFLIPADRKTSIGSGRMANQYDQIWFQADFTGSDQEFTGNADADYYFEEFYPDADDPFQTAKDRVSDHVPVWAEFRTNLEDDDWCSE